MSDIRNRLEAETRALGFTRFKVASLANPAVGIDAYDSFLSKGHHGDMQWMVRSRPPRANVLKLLPDARSIVVLGIDYWHPRPPKPDGFFGKVSRYAWGRDYHNLIGKRLRSMCRKLERNNPGLRLYFGVDSRPFIERAWAELAGIGFVGKNTMVISPSDSSYFFLAMLLVNQDIEPDTPILRDHCGQCTRCLTACPTDAFVAPFQLDARRCISYWTIEHKGDIPEQYRTKVGDWIFGCDECQEVCPHNHHPLLSTERDLSPRPNQAWVDLEWLLRASDNEILKKFEGSPLRRAGPRRLKRNSIIALANHKNMDSLYLIKDYLDHKDLMLRRHAQWAENHILQKLAKA